MNNMALMKLMSLAAVWVPWAALATIAVVTLVMTVCDRRRRRRPENPIAGSEIDALERAGKITGEEAQFLRQKTGGLPEVETRVAKPDLLLRLAAAISRIYAVMVLAILVLVMVVVVFSSFGHSVGLVRAGRSGMNSEAWLAIAAIAGWFALLVVSIGQFVASCRVLDGSRRARNWLAAAWLLSFACMHPACGARYWAPVAGCFVLWVLFRRPGVMPNISSRSKWLLPVAALGLLLLGFSWDLNFSPVATDCRGGSSGGGGLPARLERLYLLCGTPDASTRRIAAGLTKQLQAAGIPAVLVDSGEVPMLDSGREMAIWIGRGVVTIPEGIPGFDSVRHLAGQPCFQLIGVGNFQRAFEWRGMILPNLSWSPKVRIAVAEDSTAGEKEVVKKALAQLLPGLKPFLGPEALRVPAVTATAVRLPWTAPELRDFHAVLQSRGHGCQVDVYRFTPGDPASDRSAVIALLARNGFHESGDYNDTLHFGRSSGRGYETAEWLYGANRENARESSYGDWKIDVPVGLLVVNSLDERATEPDPAFAAQFFAADPTAFLCSGGIHQLAAAERETALVNFFARSDVPRRIRVKVLQEGMRDGLTLSDREKELLTTEFRKLAMEIVAAGPMPATPNDIDALRNIVGRDAWRDLASWLTAELKDICIPVDLGGEPDAKGLIRVEKQLKLSGQGFFLGRLEFSFGPYQYEPKTLWLGQMPEGDGRIRFQCGYSSSVSMPDSRNPPPSSFYIEYKLGQQEKQPPWKLQEYSSGSGFERRRTPNPGGLLVLGRYDTANSVLRLSCVFAPIREEDARWQRRLEELPHGDAKAFADGILELTRDLQANRRCTDFAARVKKLLTECPDPALRRQVGELLGESYCRIELPSVPDADGVYRARVRHPVNELTDTQVVCEIDGGATADTMILIGYGVGPEGDGTFRRIHDDEASFNLTAGNIAGDRFFVAGRHRPETPGELQVTSWGTLMGKRTNSPPDVPRKPEPGEYEWLAAPDQTGGVLEFSAAYRPEER